MVLNSDSDSDAETSVKTRRKTPKKDKKEVDTKGDFKSPKKSPARPVKKSQNKKAANKKQNELVPKEDVSPKPANGKRKRSQNNVNEKKQKKTAELPTKRSKEMEIEDEMNDGEDVENEEDGSRTEGFEDLLEGIVNQTEAIDSEDEYVPEQVNGEGTGMSEEEGREEEKPVDAKKTTRRPRALRTCRECGKRCKSVESLLEHYALVSSKSIKHTV